MKNQITVTDSRGNSHPVLAARRIDSFRVLCVRNWHSKQNPFVVHTFNEQDGGFHQGHYCETLERAMEVFTAKVGPTGGPNHAWERRTVVISA